MERVSAKRMKANYPDWLPFYKADGFTTEVRLQLERMSTSTLERFLREIRKNQAVTKGLATTKCPARYMKNKVPINTLDAKIDRPGYFQSDTVAHCGNTTAGTYVSSITLTDIYSQWTVNRAIPSKHGHEVRKMFAELERGLGFAILGLNVDSGSEFLNTPVLKFTKNTDGKDRFVYTRSRPYKKNDNCLSTGFGFSSRLILPGPLYTSAFMIFSFDHEVCILRAKKNIKFCGHCVMQSERANPSRLFENCKALN
jgi:hypothetical protein